MKFYGMAAPCIESRVRIYLILHVCKAVGTSSLPSKNMNPVRSIDLTSMDGGLVKIQSNFGWSKLRDPRHGITACLTRSGLLRVWHVSIRGCSGSIADFVVFNYRYRPQGYLQTAVHRTDQRVWDGGPPLTQRL